jgi:hypothetical protein
VDFATVSESVLTASLGGARCRSGSAVLSARLSHCSLDQRFLHKESLMPWRIVIECAEDLCGFSKMCRYKIL